MKRHYRNWRDKRGLPEDDELPPEERMPDPPSASKKGAVQEVAAVQHEDPRKPPPAAKKKARSQKQNLVHNGECYIRRKQLEEKLEVLGASSANLDDIDSLAY